MLTLTLTVTYLQDPGHGWMACARDLATDLGFIARVSGYSYFDRRNDTLWLEEDCDAGLLLDALRERGIRFEVWDQHTNNDAWVRALPHWQPATALLPEGSRHRDVEYAGHQREYDPDNYRGI